MEDSGPVVDISSDEEAGFGGGAKGEGFGRRRGSGDNSDCRWLSGIFGEVGGNTDDDSDDVVLIRETFPNPPKKSRRDSSNASGKFSGGDDDDCLILDGGPDKPAVAAPPPDIGGEVNDGELEWDDVKIIAEKGEVACRDFPHARHLCAKFLFASTAHEIHCSQCHCYVCDSVAPCPRWGTGVSSIDHCHATDKDEHWRAERQHNKTGPKPMPLLRSETSPARPVFAMGRPAHQVRARLISKPPIARSLGSHLSRRDPMGDIKKMLKERRILLRSARMRQRSARTRSSNPRMA